MGAVRESSFNMTRGDEDIEGGGGRLQKFLDTRKEGSEKLGGALKIGIQCSSDVSKPKYTHIHVYSTCAYASLVCMS